MINLTLKMNASVTRLTCATTMANSIDAKSIQVKPVTGLNYHLNDGCYQIAYSKTNIKLISVIDGMIY